MNRGVRLLPPQGFARRVRLVVASAVFLSACDGFVTHTDQEYLQRARDFHAQGKTSAAVIELKNALQKNPKNHEARLLLGEIYVAGGQGREAEKELRKAIEAGASAERVKVALAGALLAARDYEKAVAETQVTDKTPAGDVARLLELRARAMFALGKVDQACALASESNKRDGALIEAYFSLARCGALRGQPQEARAQIDRALQVDPKSDEAWALLGDIERGLERLAEAEAAYGKALELNPDLVGARLGRAIVRIRAQRLAEADEDVGKVLGTAKNHPVGLQLRGVILYHKGEFKDAKTTFETVLKVAPGLAQAHLWLGLTNLVLKDHEQAISELVKFNQVVPNSLQGQALLALARGSAGQIQGAREALAPLRNLNVENPHTLATLGKAFMSLGEGDVAARYLEQAVGKTPEMAALRVEYARSLLRKGETERALAELDKAAQLDPKLSVTDELRIPIFLRSGQLDKALGAAEALEKRHPDQPLAYNLKGSVLIARKDFDGARKSFETAMQLDRLSIAAAVNLAQLDLLQNKPVDARKRFETVLDRDKANVTAMLGIAGVAAAQGQEAEYLAWLDKAAAVDPNSAGPKLLLVKHYLRKGDAHQALALARELAAQRPQDPAVIDALGSAQQASGELDSAAKTYMRLAELSSGSPVALVKLAGVQLALKQTDSAAASARKALQTAPRFSEAMAILALIDVGAGRYDKAMSIARELEKEDPKNPLGPTMVGDILLAQGQAANAAKAYERAFGLQQTGLLAIKIHQAASAAAGQENADARLKQWLTEHPADAATRAYLAASYVQRRQWPKAVEQYEVLAKLAPENALALNDLAWLYQQQKDARALETAERAYQLDPRDPRVMDTLAMILLDAGNSTRAVQLLEKAVDRAPGNSELRYHHALALAKAGDKSKARKELAELLARDKAFKQRAEATALLRQL